MPHRLNRICRVVVLAAESTEAEAVADAVRGLGANCEIALDATRLREILVSTPCNGLMLSVRSAVRADAAGKALIRTVELVYPTARIKRRPSDGSFSALPSQGGSARTLPDFLASCAAFEARRIRRSERIPKTLNALLSADPDAEEPERTFTLDLSAGGAFLHSVRDWREGDTLHLSFQELPWESPVRAEVRHVFPWGTPFRARGIGVRFDGLAPGHAANLNFLLYGKKG